MQQPDVETLFRLNGVAVEPERLPVLRDAYTRWLVMTAPLREPFSYTDEPLFPPAGPR